MQWIPPLVTAAGVVVAMITLGWQVYSKLDSKIDALREEMQAGFREVNQRFADVDRRFVEMITAMGSMSERIAAVEARSERDSKTVELLQASALGLSIDADNPDRAEKTQRREATGPAAAGPMPATT